jgi:hypothetical protein
MAAHDRTNETMADSMVWCLRILKLPRPFAYQTQQSRRPSSCFWDFHETPNFAEIPYLSVRHGNDSDRNTHDTEIATVLRILLLICPPHSTGCAMQEWPNEETGSSPCVMQLSQATLTEYASVHRPSDEQHKGKGQRANGPAFPAR